MANLVKLPRFVTLLLAGAIYASSLSIAVGQDSQVVGFSDATVQGNGLLTFDSICADEFPGSHWCQSEEVVRGGIFGDPLQVFPINQTAWIHPTIVAGDSTVAVDYSGFTGHPRSDLTCNGWTSNSFGVSGLALLINAPVFQATIATTDCSFTEIRVACCSVTRKKK